MLHFVIPFKSKKISKDWERDSELCVRTVKGLLRQTSEAYTVTLACHQRPLGFGALAAHKKVNLIERPDLWMPPDPTYKNGLRSDKDHKLRIAMASLRKFEKGYLMPIDADDAVHIRLAEFVRNAPRGINLFYADQGYLYNLSTGFLYRKRSMHHRTGTSLIARWEADDLPQDERDRSKPPILAMDRGHLSHKGVVNGARQDENLTVRAIPFPSVCYVVGTGVNLTGGGVGVSRTLMDKAGAALKAALRFWQLRYPGKEWRRSFGLE